MKKIWFLGLAVLLVIPFTSACSINGEYKVLHKAIVDFTTDNTYAEFFDGNIIFYDKDTQQYSGLQNAKNDTSSYYYSITYYEQVIKMSLSNLKNFYGPFESAPTYNTNRIKKICSAVTKNINAFKQQVEKFNTRRDNMVFQYKLSINAGIQTYNDFKTDLGLLAQSANNLQLSFINALTSLYYPFDSQTDTVSPSKTECGVAKTFSTLIDDYFKYAILENNYEHPDTVCDLYYSLTQQLMPKLNIKNPTIKTENFATWLTEYKLFQNEHNMFSTAINNVDMTTDVELFSGASKSFYTKVSHYVDSHNGTTASASYFVNRTISLLY